MNEKQLQEIEARRELALCGPNTAHGFVERDALVLLHEVRRLQAVVAEYAKRENWLQISWGPSSRGEYSAWKPEEPGYTRAEECLREDGE